MIKNITLSADEALIKQANQQAMTGNTTLIHFLAAELRGLLVLT